MKKTILATLTLAAVFLLAGNLFAQNVDEQASREKILKILKGMDALSFSAPSLNTNASFQELEEYISKFFQTENIVERNKIVDEAIEKLPLAESEILVFLDSMGNYITPFIEELLTAETLEDFDKSKALLTMFTDRLDNKVKIYNDSISNAETTEAANKAAIQRNVLEIYGSIYYPVALLWNKEAFEEASKQVYDYMVLYKEMEISATRKITTMPSYEEFKKKLSKQIVSYASLYPHIVIEAPLNHKDLGLQKYSKLISLMHDAAMNMKKMIKNLNLEEYITRKFDEAARNGDKEALESLRKAMHSFDSKLDPAFVETMDKKIMDKRIEIEKGEEVGKALKNIDTNSLDIK